MHNWDEREETGVCTAEHDFELVGRICQLLQLPPPLRLRFVAEYWNRVFTHMVEGYKLGITPNPDVLCNIAIKFDVFFKRVVDDGATRVLTGHYARRGDARTRGDDDDPLLKQVRNRARAEQLREEEPFALLEATDGGDATNAKCQTYFVAGLPQTVLSRVEFPVGHLPKSRVYELAAQAGLPEVCEKKESTGLCFVGERHFPIFLSQYLDPHPGTVLSLDLPSPASVGKAQSRGAAKPVTTSPFPLHVLGQHPAVETLTLSQNVRLPGLPSRHYVVGRDMARKLVAAVPDRNHPVLFATDLLVDELEFTRPQTVAEIVNQHPLGRMEGIEVRIRHGGDKHAAMMEVLRDETDVARAAGGPMDSSLDTAPTSPSVIGYMPDIDPQQLWSNNVQQAWRLRQTKGLLGLPSFQGGHFARNAEPHWQQRLAVLRCHPAHYAPTPGQIAVLYYRGQCLGKARIIAARAGM